MRYKFYVLKFIIILSFSTISYAQAPVSTIGTSTSDEGGSTILKHPSGDFFIGGFANDSALIIRRSSTGSIIWSRTYDFGPNENKILEIVLTSTGHIIGCGIGVDPNNIQNYYSFAFKIDINGNPLWMRRIKKGAKLTATYSIFEAQNGNYRSCGAFHNNTNHSDSYIIEYDQNTGNTVWDTLYAFGTSTNGWDESFYEGTRSVTGNADYFTGRFQTAGGQLSYRPTITKIDNSGNHAWTRIYNYTVSTSGGRLYGTGIEVDGDSLVVTLNGKNVNANTPFDCGILKTDLDGNCSWAKWFTNTGNNHLRVWETLNIPSGYLITGFFVTNNADLFLIKTDKQGNVVWSYAYGSTGIEDLGYPGTHSRLLVDGANIILTGRTSSFGSSEDVIVFSVDLASGLLNSTGCTSPFPIVELPIPNYSEPYPIYTEILGLTNTSIVNNSSNHSIQSGNLVEHYTDTIISGDTVYLCPGDDVTVRADWDSGLSYNWSSGGTSQVEIISTGGMHTVEVSGGGCILWSDSVFVVIDSAFTDLGSDTTVCNSSAPILLDAQYAGATYSWQDGSTNSTFSVTTSGIYWVDVAVGGCVITDSIDIQFVSIPAPDLGNDTSLCQGSSLLLDVTTPNATYLWQDGSTQATFNASSTGTYWVETSLSGCVSSDTMLLDYLPSPTPNLGNDTIICDVTANVLLDAFEIGATYIWQDGSTNSDFTALNSGIYWVEVNLGGCLNTDSIDIQLVSFPAPNLGNDTSLCNGNDLLLDASTPGVTYLWQDGSSLPTFNANATGTYWVETSISGCAETDTLLLNYLPSPTPDLGNDTVICDITATLYLDVFESGATYIWQDGSTNSDFTALSSGIFWVQSNLAGCTFTDSIQIDISAIPSINLGPDTSLCDNLTLAISTGNLVASHLWNTGQTANFIDVNTTGDYWVELTENGCSNSDTIHVDFIPSVSIDLGIDTSFCSFVANYLLDVTTPGCTYLWQDGSTNSTFTVSTSGTYWVHVDNGSCSDDDTVTISFDSFPVLDLGPDTTICLGTSLILDASYPGCTYEWQDGTSASNLDVSASGVYWVEANLSGCIAFDTIVVETIAPPNINFLDVAPCYDELFIADASQPEASYLWQDGSTNSLITIDENGTYWVIVSNPCGVDTSTFVVHYTNCMCEIYIPNAFTPDGDQLNNDFKVISDCPLYSYEIQIFNRWGELIFTSTDLNESWDATYKDTLVQDGIYTWKVTYMLDDDVPETITGHVNVLR